MKSEWLKSLENRRTLWWKQNRKVFVVGAFVFVLLLVGTGIFSATRSDQFTVRVVEIPKLETTQGVHHESPLSHDEILAIANVPVGKSNLFHLNLNKIEERLTQHPWIEQVRLEKKFPQTLSIQVDFREPEALFQAGTGDLYYIDARGETFEGLRLEKEVDLPVISGLTREDPRLKTVLKTIQYWNENKTHAFSRISSLSWDSEKGFRAIFLYPLARQKKIAQTFVFMGQDLDLFFQQRIGYLSEVIEFLVKKSINARQVFTESDKKLVVKRSTAS